MWEPLVARKRTRRKRSSGSDADDRYWFDEATAARAVGFIEGYCRHSIGQWAGEPFILEPWQKDLVRNVFGWKRRDGTRRYRTVFVTMARKNGKSTLAAAIAACLLFIDQEPGAQVFSCAADRDQARIVFGETQRMVAGSPELSSRAEILKSAIMVEATGSVYRVLSADAHTKHGLNPHGVLFDELHAQPNRDLWDVMVTGTGSRRQPLMFAITTAGYDRETIGHEVYEHACRVRDGIVEDDSFLPMIFELAEDDDWADERNWAKANPNLGISVKLDDMREQAAKAAVEPAFQNTFRRLRLNQWTEQETRAIDMNAWAACGAPVNWAELAGQPCYAGLDLSSKTDLSALALVFPRPDGTYAVLTRFWIPEENMPDRIKRDRVPFDAWVRDGFVEATAGNVIDYTFIRKRVKELASGYDIREIAYDPWNATQLATQLIEEDGLNLVEHRQHFSHMSEPTQQFLALIPARRIWHGGNPVLTWNAGNLVTKENADGNIRPIKGDKRKRIDGLVATIMAFGRAIKNASPPSVYETRGFLELG